MVATASDGDDNNLLPRSNIQQRADLMTKIRPATKSETSTALTFPPLIVTTIILHKYYETRNNSSSSNTYAMKRNRHLATGIRRMEEWVGRMPMVTMMMITGWLMAEDGTHSCSVNIHKRWHGYYEQKRKPYACLPHSPSIGREGFVVKF